MVLVLIFYFVLLTISATHSASAAPSSEPLLSIPVYHTSMLNRNHTLINSDPNFSAGVLYPDMDAKANLYPNDNAYAVFLWLGTPVQIILVMVDTGNHFTWSQCQPCSKCHPQFRPLFDPRTSSTLRDLTCDSDTCRIPEMKEIFTNCYKESCDYNIKYAEQSRSSGRVVTDILNFPHSDTEVKDFIMGCGDSHEGPFRVHFSGVFGLGRGPLSVQSQLNAKAFSLCLLSPTSEKPTTLDFYELSPTQDHYDSSSIMVPLWQNDRYPYYYFVQFVGIGINGFMLDIPSRVWGYGLNYGGGVVIETGSNIMQLPSDAYRVFSSEVSRTIHNLTYKSGPKGLDFCYADDPSNVYPTMELYFENGSTEGERFVTLKLGTDQILYRPEQGVICLAYGEQKHSALTLIGNIHLQGTLVTYDLANNLIVFTPEKC